MFGGGSAAGLARAWHRQCFPLEESDLSMSVVVLCICLVFLRQVCVRDGMDREVED